MVAELDERAFFDVKLNVALQFDRTSEKRTARDDDANTALLLGQLAEIPGERRGAAFVCAAALVTPDGDEHVLERQWRGRVIHEKRGTNGFGYDPVFVPDGLQQTSAELDPAEKDARSHRGQAFAALVPVIRTVLGGR